MRVLYYHFSPTYGNCLLLHEAGLQLPPVLQHRCHLAFVWTFVIYLPLAVAL